MRSCSCAFSFFFDTTNSMGGKNPVSLAHMEFTKRSEGAPLVQHE
jgi:hypothetical protein